MTNNYSRLLSNILGTLLLCCLAHNAYAIPMDVEASKQIPQLAVVFANVRENGRLSEQDLAVVETSLATGDPVLVSLAARIVMESKDDETNLCAKASNVLNDAEAMPQAFIRLLLAKKRAEKNSAAEKVAVLEAFLDDPNPFLQVEAAKELLKNDAQKGEVALRKLLASGSQISKGMAFDQLHKLGKAADATPVPMPDERYELLMSIVEKASDK